MRARFFSRRSSVKLLDCEPDEIGAKAQNLIWLAENGARVPATWVVRRSASLDGIPAKHARFAVRSSATTEDGHDQSRAGQLLTVLDVETDDLASAVEQVIESGDHSERVAVVIQEMVEPVVSGAVFSRNPVTGLSDIVVEAIRGRGDALLAQGADPLRWVSRSGTFVDSAESARDLDPLIRHVVTETSELSRRYGPADLEWVWDGTHLWWVQIRPITALDDIPIYSRRISKDVMPGMIKPLVWSVNVPMVNTAWVRLITEAIGPNELDPMSLAESFAYRAYFNMAPFGDIFEKFGMPRDSLENLLGLPGEKSRMRPGAAAITKLPRLLTLAWRFHRSAEALEQRRQLLQEDFRQLSRSMPSDQSDEDLIHEIRHLERLGVEAAYLDIVVPLLANLYTLILKRLLDRGGYRFEDMEPFSKGDWDFGPALDLLREALENVDEDIVTRVVAGELEQLNEASAQHLEHLLDRFGHLSESANDLSVPRWRDDPHVVLSLAARSVQKPASSPTAWDDLQEQLSPIRRLRIERWRKRAAELSVLREAVSSTFTFGYGLLRPRFLELGRRLRARGLIDDAEDVFYLAQPDLLSALSSPSPDPMQGLVTAVRAEMQTVSDAVMPDMIVGGQWVPEPSEVSERLEGVGASGGRYRGIARFVGRLAEADRLGDGDVLVVDRSDVTWTPLFSRAGAVVTESGGLLAHSSITAREMGLPCVASVHRARLLDGEMVVVDGTSGEVVVERIGETAEGDLSASPSGRSE